MKQHRLMFLKQYLAAPSSIGAVLPSSKHLAEKMTKIINFRNADCIVEYGPGTGVFTKKILEKRKKGTILVLFEKNPEFHRILNEKFPNETDFHVINDSALNAGKHLDKLGISTVGHIVSGLPFASLPVGVSEKILSGTKKILKPDGRFITFQYTMMKKSFIGQYFEKIEITRELRNFPPAYVFNCSDY